MNLGANVPPDGLLRTEDRNRCDSLLLIPATPIPVADWLRECAIGDTGESGDCITLDLDLACPGGGPGDGVP